MTLLRGWCTLICNVSCIFHLMCSFVTSLSVEMWFYFFQFSWCIICVLFNHMIYIIYFISYTWFTYVFYMQYLLVCLIQTIFLLIFCHSFYLFLLRDASAQTHTENNLTGAHTGLSLAEVHIKKSCSITDNFQHLRESLDLGNAFLIPKPLTFAWLILTL